jgi:Domain of unknown function (DUF4383)
MAVATDPRAEPRSERRVEKGFSLARGPALILGTILLAAGLYFIYKQHTFPKFSQFPSGHAHVRSKVLFGIFGANGWTGMLTAICGGLLLFGAAQHLLAKTMSLIVGIVLAAAAIIGVSSSGNVLGLAGANGWTELAWGIAAAILLFNTLIPRRRRVIEPADGEGVGRHRTGVGTGAAVAGGGAAGAAEREHVAHRERVDERDAGAGEPVDERGAAGEPVDEHGAAGERAGERGAAGEPAGERETPADRAGEPVAGRGEAEGERR